MNLSKAAVVAALMITSPVFAGEDTEHGNNPSYEWSGVNVGGIDFAVPVGVWVMFEMLAPDVMGPASDCLETAIQGCGEGRICCYCVVVDNGDGSCFFSCQDNSGNCQPCPACDAKDLWPWLPPDDQR